MLRGTLPDPFLNLGFGGVAMPQKAHKISANIPKGMIKVFGKTLIERHKIIYQCLDMLMKTEIHTLSIKALSPTEV